MTGAMAGTAVLNYQNPTSTLRVVTVTVNNRCNLRCSHCYLQYSGVDRDIGEGVIDLLARGQFEHLAIVGKEPLVDKESAERCMQLIGKCGSTGKTVSLITNGLGLRLLRADVLRQLAWIDVSIDGGSQSYSRYRRAKYGKLMENLAWVKRNCETPVNALHVLSAETVPWVSEMVAVEKDYSFARIVFSAYQQSRNQGTNTAVPLALDTLLCSLARSPGFAECPSALLLVGHNSFLIQGFSDEDVLGMLQEHGLARRAIVIKHDPLKLGFVRVTYDGLVLSPEASVHPAEYAWRAKRLGFENLTDLFLDFSRAACISELMDGRNLN